MAASKPGKSGLRTLISGFLGRFVRRGFFRLVFLLFLLGAVMPFAALQAIANRGSANLLLENVVAQVFDLNVADVSWNRESTAITGPDLALRGTIEYRDVRVSRRAGSTPHPEREPLQYDFVRIPNVRITYDLKRLPQPVVRIEIWGGLSLHFNIHGGTWLDQDLFLTGEGEAAPPELPQIILGDEATVRLRADGILVAPEDFDRGVEWYDFSLKNLSLLTNPSEPDRYQINGDIESERFKNFVLGGHVARTGREIEVEFRTREDLHFNRDYAAVLADDVRATVEQFSIDARRTRMKGKLSIRPDEELRFDAHVRADDGKVCYVGFPLLVEDVGADIVIVNNSLTVDAIGRRDGATVSVFVDVKRIGTASESLQVDVDIRDLMVDESFRLGLLDTRQQPDNQDYATGLPYPEDEFDAEAMVRARGTRGYPEWPGPAPWEGGQVYPNLDAIFPFVSRAFAPLGLADFRLRFQGNVIGINPETTERTREDSLSFKVFLRDATAAFVGLPESGPGFPVPLRNVYGVIEGRKSKDQPGRYDVRGYTQAELEDELGSVASAGLVAHPQGLIGTLSGPGEQVFINAVYQDHVDPQQARLQLNVSTRGVEFDERIMSRLPPAVRQRVEAFVPRGPVNVEMASLLIMPRSETELVYDFRLAAAGLAAVYHFPGAAEAARFDEVQGTIVVDSVGDVVRLERLRGRLAGSRVNVSFLEVRGNSIQSFLVESDEFEVRPELESVLPPGIATVLRNFKPRGHVRMRIETVGEAGLDFMEADVRFLPPTADRTSTIEFSRFPYVLSNVEGRLFVTMRPDSVQVAVRQFSGRGQGDARVVIDGLVTMPTGNEAGAAGEESLPVVDVHINAERVPTESNLLRAFTSMAHQAGMAEEGKKPRMIEFIEDLNMTGTFGVSGRFVIDDGGQMDWRFELLLEGAGVRFRHFALPVQELFGAVIVERAGEGADVSMRNVRGRTGEGEVFLHSAGFSDERGWHISASGRQLDFTDAGLRGAFPEDWVEFRNMLSRLSPVGKFDIDLHLTGKDEFKTYKVSLDTWETNVDLGLNFDRMTARFDVEGVLDGATQRMNGAVFIKEVYFKRARFNDITTSVQFFEDRLLFPNLRGYFYDGWVEGRFAMQGSAYDGDISIRAADLSGLGRTAFPDAGELMGAMDAEVKFYSPPDRTGMIGRGRVDVQPFDRSSDDPARNTCKLAPVPLFNAIFEAIGQEQNFDEGHVFFWFGGDRVIIREMDFVSDSARVEIFGGDDENWIAYDTTQMKMKLFFTLAPRSPIAIPLLQDILDLLKQILFPLFVTGTLNDPSVEPFSRSAEDLEREQDEFPRRPRGG